MTDSASGGPGGATGDTTGASPQANTGGPGANPQGTTGGAATGNPGGATTGNTAGNAADNPTGNAAGNAAGDPAEAAPAQPPLPPPFPPSTAPGQQPAGGPAPQVIPTSAEHARDIGRAYFPPVGSPDGPVSLLVHEFDEGYLVQAGWPAPEDPTALPSSPGGANIVIAKSDGEVTYVPNFPPETAIALYRRTRRQGTS
ncbi:hypothetical protein GCM10010211_63790 [Streptomyces albospinus]|uniref:Uncharacterized protein n=1 Tax=Streptomyces albospinus TaxID=285515 RepID=A0ABQ2VIE4_9ACTN|nr:hypothetical protein [Streptomyces albospinus]GGU88597.1 hypothetical protein GCM10010211_63790 [Streptomyces albospinus]